MPYVEGESLRDRLTREKQLPLEDALLVPRVPIRCLVRAAKNARHPRAGDGRRLLAVEDGRALPIQRGRLTR